MNTASKLSALCLAFAFTACAGADDSAADTAAIDIAPSAVDVIPGPTSTPAAATGEADLIHVPLREWSVTVSKSVIAPGATTFHAMNEGTYTHAFEIEGNGQEWRSDPIPPGGTATLTPTLTAGTYEVYCPIADTHGNHQQRGMRTTFTVR